MKIVQLRAENIKRLKAVELAVHEMNAALGEASRR